MMSEIAGVVLETAKISLLVLLMMVLVDLLNLWTRGKLGRLLAGRGQWRQYLLVPFVAALPGCVGAFSVVSLYMHGMISFGALAGGMLAASGDEAFVMLSLFPGRAMILFLLLTLLGIALGWVTDHVVRRFRITTCEDCPDVIIHQHEGGWRHYLREHVWDHIIRRHLWRTAIWTFGALLAVKLGMGYADLSGVISRYPLVLLATAGLMGLIPESGPHLIFVTLFANDLIPFSVLLTSAIVQDGHGMLPMLAHSIRASLVLKAFNLTFGIVVGLLAFAAGY